jgi:hypothetical protein
MGTLGRIRAYKKVEKWFKNNSSERVIEIENLWGFTSEGPSIHKPASLSTSSLSGGLSPVPNHGEYLLVITDQALYRGDDPDSMYRIPLSALDSIDYIPASGGIAEMALRSSGAGIADGHPMVQYWYVPDGVAIGLQNFLQRREK